MNPWTPLLVATFGWGSAAVLTRALLNSGVSPFTVVPMRFGIALFTLLLSPASGYGSVALIVVTGCGASPRRRGPGLPNTLFTMGLVELPVSLGGLMVALIPGATVGAAHFLVEGERFNPRSIPGLIVSLIGTGILVGVGGATLEGVGNLSRGVAFSLIAVCFAGIGGALTRRFALEVGGDGLVIPQFAVATILAVVAMPFLDITAFPSIEPSQWALLVALGTFATAVPFTAFLIAAQVNPASRLSVAGYLVPVLAVILAVIFLGEVHHPHGVGRRHPHHRRSRADRASQSTCSRARHRHRRMNAWRRLPSAPMSRRILVAVAWPYASGSLHLGHLAGAYLPADIFARYHRLAGNEVLMVSGSDVHGTPITVRADNEGVTPQVIVDRYHAEFLGYWDEARNLVRPVHHDGDPQPPRRSPRTSSSGFWRRATSSNEHRASSTTPRPSASSPTGMSKGPVPTAAIPEARGDQCENCGRTLDATDLIDPRSRLSGATPVLTGDRALLPPALRARDPLREWLESKAAWRRHVKNWALGMVNEGLPDRAITRDIEWGVEVPVDDLGPGKRIYVWFDAVIGYLSAAKEWAQIHR